MCEKIGKSLLLNAKTCQIRSSTALSLLKALTNNMLNWLFFVL